MAPSPEILVRGAGVAGLVSAVSLAERGAHVTLSEIGDRVGAGASWMAGGMLAPWCEAESAPDIITQRSVTAVEWWKAHVPDTIINGSLVVAPPRDTGELRRFARMTSHFREIGASEIGQLEPDLGDRFSRALFFPEEGQVDPRKALEVLKTRLVSLGGTVCLNDTARHDDRLSESNWDYIIDCRGYTSRHQRPSLRGVRGEMLLLKCPDVTLHRPVRMLHPRIPIYIVPRADHIFMVGATMIESNDDRGITLRSMSELLNAAWTLSPAFSEAEIVDIGTGLRPSYPDNIPAVTREGRTIHVNGMYRHGFLLSPALASEVCDIIFGVEHPQTS